MESDFSPFFHFLQRSLSEESSNIRTNPADQSYSRVHPRIYFSEIQQLEVVAQVSFLFHLEVEYEHLFLLVVEDKFLFRELS